MAVRFSTNYLNVAQLFVIFCCACFMNNAHGYGLPILGLGSSSFLDGGPLRPKPGWYIQQYFQYYTTHRFLDTNGNNLGSIPSPNFNSISVASQVIYQWEKKVFLQARPGIDVTLPMDLYAKVQQNPLGITNSGNGLGDLIMGVYLQWDTIMHEDRPIFVHRIEFDASFPTGKNDEPKKLINPGNNIFFIDPYWSATLYFTPRFSASWRLNYLWCGHDKKIDLKAGDAIHGSYALEYWLLSNLFIGINGYFLKQLKNDRLNGAIVPHSREQVFALGPGLLYLISNSIDFVFFANLYFESHVKNRTKGIKLFLRLFKHF